MSSAFVHEGASIPQIFNTRDSAESAAAMYRQMDGGTYDFEIRERQRGGFMVARLQKDGTFDSWVEE